MDDSMFYLNTIKESNVQFEKIRCKGYNGIFGTYDIAVYGNIVVVRERPDNRGVSVTNNTERLIEYAHRRYRIAYVDMKFFECYAHRHKDYSTPNGQAQIVTTRKYTRVFHTYRRGNLIITGWSNPIIDCSVVS